MVKRIFSGMMAVVVFVSGLAIPVAMDGIRDRVYAANTTVTGVVNPPEKTDDERWELVWHDEFNDGSLNDNIWDMENDANSKYNSELQYYTTTGDNIKFDPVGDGEDNEMLVIVAKKEQTENADLSVDDATGEVTIGTKEFTSARINTLDKVWFNPGDSNFTKPDQVEVVNCTKIEARMKMPAFAGSWPAFWMMGTIGEYPNNGEIDVMENINGENKVHGTAHWASNDGGTASSTSNINIDVTDWHTYSVIWSDTKVEWYVDDQLYHIVNVANRDNMQSLFGPQYILLNLAVGGEMTGYISAEDIIDQNVFDEIGASQLEVDYVRAYSKVDDDKEINKNKVQVRHDSIFLFEGQLFDGTWGGDLGTLIKKDAGFTISINQTGGDIWAPQAGYKDIMYEPGTSYTFSSTILSDLDKSIIIVIQGDDNIPLKEIYINLKANQPYDITEDLVIPPGYNQPLNIIYFMGGDNIAANIEVSNTSFITYTEMELEELVDKHYTGFTSSGGTYDTIANVTTDEDKHGFVADITHAGEEIWSSQVKIADVDYHPGSYHTFVATIKSDVDRTIYAKIEGTGTDSLGEGTIKLEAGKEYTYVKDVYIDADYAYRDDDNVDIIFALGGGMGDPDGESTITVTDASFYPADSTNIQTLRYYTEVGQEININVPNIASRKSIIAPVTATLWEELNVKLDYTNVTNDINNTGNLETNYDNLQRMEFTAEQTGVDAYTVKYNYINPKKPADAATEFRATETVELVINNYDAPDRIYVLDYGVPVQLNGGDNDIYSLKPASNISTMYKAGYEQVTVRKLGAKSKNGSTLPATYSYSSTDFVYDSEFAGSKGQGTVKSELSPLDKVNVDTITYTPNRFMSEIDEFYYGMQVFEIGYPMDGVPTDYTNATPVMTGNVQVMPANIVYYEDNYGTTDNNNINNSTGIIYSGNYQEVGTTGDSLYQNNSLDVQYGNDEAYMKGDDKYSNGSAHEMFSNSTAVFKFKGTGLDIMSRASNTTGYIGVVIYKDDEDATITKEDDVLQVKNAEPVKSILINTYYSSGDIYQLPVISWKNETNTSESYIVKIISVSAEKQSIFIDGIRVYNPMKGNEIAEGQYGDNSEINANITEVREMILGKDAKIDYHNPLESVVGNNQKASLIKYSDDGTYFMAGKTVVEAYVDPKDDDGSSNKEVTDPDIVQGLLSYVISGPNNELYIGDGYGFGFELIGTPETLQIGVKKVSGTYNGVENNGAITLEYLDINNEWKKIADVTSATEIYYRIHNNDFYVDSQTGKKCVIFRVTGGTLSFTNVKFLNCEFAPLSTLITDNSTINEGLIIENLKFASSAQNPIKVGSQVKFSVVTSTNVTELVVGTCDNPGNVDGKLTGKINSDIALFTTKDTESLGNGKIKWDVKMYIPDGDAFANKTLYLMGYDINGNYSYLTKLN